jgi:chromosome segregation ATPase
MGKLSNIFGILALLLAGAAAYFSFAISERRTEFRLRADKTATALVDVVKAVDADSGTFLANNISFNPGDPKAGTKESGSLGWKSFQEAKDESGAYAAFQNLLNQAVAHVNSLGRQRNDLAETLVDVSTSLTLPDGIIIADLRNLGDATTFERANAKIKRHAAAVAARDKALIDAVVQASNAIDQPIRESALTTRRETHDADGQPILGEFTHENELADFNRNVASLNERSRSYAQTLVEAIDTISAHEGVFRWSADRNRLRDPNAYAGALTQMVNDFGKINEQLGGYVLAKREVAQLGEKVDKLEDDLDRAQKELTTTQDQLAKATTRIEQLMRDAGIEVEGVPTNFTGDPTVAIKGKVLSVDNEYNYVIVDLGARYVDDNTELLVARDDKLVARIRVAKVLSRISVADILPSAMQGTVQADDLVILSALQPEAEKR